MVLLESRNTICFVCLMMPLLWVAVAASVRAQVPDSTVTCSTGTAEAYLDIGNVRARIPNNGGLFWNGAPNVYEVPKGGGVDAIFAASFWLGGMVDDSLRMAASRYGPWEFWPGPILPEGISEETCARYDRIHEMTKDDQVRRGPESDERLRNWPVDVGAPFMDANGDGLYDPEHGDRPELLGDQQLWWVMNDLGGEHELTRVDPLGVEVRVTAFAFDAPGAVGNSTFYRYRIRNTSDREVTQTYAGLYVDADVGVTFDDYSGSDSTLGLGYNYNADDDDTSDRQVGYGAAPPAIGYTVLKRPAASEACPYPDGKSIGFTNVMPWFQFESVAGFRPDGSDLYNHVRSRWDDGRHLTIGGIGRNYSDVPIDFGYPGDPVTGAYWSELNAIENGTANVPADRQVVNGLGPFCMPSGEEVELVIAIVWSRGSSNLDSVRQLKEDVAYIQSIRDIILTPRSLPERDMEEPEVPLALGVYPNPAGAEGATVRLSIPEALDVNVEVYDLLGRRVHVAAGTGRLGGGEHQWTLPTGGWAPGVYIVRIQAGPVVSARRLVVTFGT